MAQELNKRLEKLWCFQIVESVTKLLLLRLHYAMTYFFQRPFWEILTSHR